MDSRALKCPWTEAGEQTKEGQAKAAPAEKKTQDKTSEQEAQKEYRRKDQPQRKRAERQVRQPPVLRTVTQVQDRFPPQ